MTGCLIWRLHRLLRIGVRDSCVNRCPDLGSFSLRNVVCVWRSSFGSKAPGIKWNPPPNGQKWPMVPCRHSIPHVTNRKSKHTRYPRVMEVTSGRVYYTRCHPTSADRQREMMPREIAAHTLPPISTDGWKQATGNCSAHSAFPHHPMVRNGNMHCTATEPYPTLSHTLRTSKRERHDRFPV